MAGTSLFPIAVEIAFGADPMAPIDDTTVLPLNAHRPLNYPDALNDVSPVWTDVSWRVLRSRTISTSRGSGESGEVEPGRGQIVLTNDDGDMTPGVVGAYGLVRNRLPIRIRAVLDAEELVPPPPTPTSDVIWTGLIEKLAMGYDNGVRPIVTATLIDRWARFKARTLTGERILQVCQALGADDLWPLTDPTGATRAENLTTSQWVLKSEAAPVDWSTAPNPTTGGTTLPAVVHCKTGSLGSALTLAWDGPGSASPGMYSAGLSWSAWLRCTSAGYWGQVMVDTLAYDGISLAAYQDHLDVDAYSLGISSFGAPITLTSSATWRHVALTASVSGSDVTLSIYVDGALAATRTGTKAGWLPMYDWLVQGVGADVGYLATWDRPLTADEVAVIAGAGLDALGQTGQTADQRADLIAALWSPSSATTLGSCSATMSKQAVDGVSQADLLQQCATTEGGILCMSRDGWPVLQSRGYRSEQDLFAVIPAAVLASDAQWELDDTTIVNVAQVDRMALGEVASTVTRRNDASVATYTEVSKSVQAWYDTDVQAVDRANVEAAMWADPSPRSRTFAVDLATCRSELGLGYAINIDIGTRISVSDLPATAPAQTASGWYVDAIADEITEKSWKRTFTVTPAVDFLVLDDATFGALDSWPLG